jgi:hypothetical protein
MDLVQHICVSRQRLLSHLNVAKLGPVAGSGSWAVVYAIDDGRVVKFQRMRGICTDDPLVPYAPGRDPDEDTAQAAMCPSEFSVASAVRRTWHELAALQCLAHTRAVPRLASHKAELAQSALAVPMEHLGAPLSVCTDMSLPMALLIADALYVVLDRLREAGAVHGDIHAGQVYWVADERRVVLGDWGPPPRRPLSSVHKEPSHADDRAAVARLVQCLARCASSPASCCVHRTNRASSSVTST